MNYSLSAQISSLLRLEHCASSDVFSSYKKRLTEGNLLRSQNPSNHFCVYFLPFNPRMKQVFLIHHRKSGLWLFPGGHIEDGEFLHDALTREIQEELGIKNTQLGNPFLYTITTIRNPKQICRKHYDIWFLYETDGKSFREDSGEFLEAHWMIVSQAGIRIKDPNTILALKIVGLKMSS